MNYNNSLVIRCDDPDIRYKIMQGLLNKGFLAPYNPHAALCYICISWRNTAMLSSQEPAWASDRGQIITIEDNEDWMYLFITA